MTELKTNVEWKRWGKSDPLWAVAAKADKQKDGPAPWTEEEFYALGESDWRDFLLHWQQYGIDTRSCLEIGCGAGRITRQLARSFDQVHAVDVSEEMVGCARNAVDQKNVEFTVIDGLHLPQSDCSVKAIFSTHVLQHLDSVDIGFSYFREFFRVLDAGGTMMIHLPLYQFPNEPGKIAVLMRFLYAAFRQFDGIRSDAKRRLGRKIMRWTPYPIRHSSLYLADLGFKNIEFRIISPKSDGEPHAFVFASK
jgi:ubiquinone/menaquinone biosynthesis C-methylase UbiE